MSVESARRSLPLDGVLVADFSRVLAGPAATMILADFGADVVKVERPGEGDETRTWGPPWASGHSTYFLALNRNKRSITLDLDDPDDVRRAHQLVRRADVLVENFRPGTLERFGLDYESLERANARLVYCSISGFGDSQHAAALPGYDLLVQAMSGIMAVTGEPAGQPMRAGLPIVDQVTSLQAVIGIMLALAERERSGQGQKVSVSLFGSALAAFGNFASTLLNTGAEPQRSGNRHPSIVPYQAFPTSDGHFVVTCGNDGQFRRLCTASGVPELADDPRFLTNALRVAHVDELDAELTARFVTGPTAHWVEVLTGVNVPAGPISSLADAFALADRIGLAPAVGSPGARSVRNPVTLGATPAEFRSPPPELGEHSAAVIAQLLLDAPRLADRG